MLIDDIDFAELYRQQLRFAGRTEKSPAHWDARAEKMSISCSDPADSYLVQLLAKIDLTGDEREIVRAGQAGGCRANGTVAIKASEQAGGRVAGEHRRVPCAGE